MKFGGETFTPVAGLSPNFFYELVNDGRKSIHHVFQLVVIGSGPGGSTVAMQAANRGIDTLVIEKGCIAPGEDFLDHKRRSNESGPYDTLYEAVSHPPLQTPDSNYIGGEVHTWGGKSRFWGGLSLKMKPWEIACCRGGFANYLRHSAAYNDAAKVIGVKYPSSGLQERTMDALRRLHPAWRHEAAGYAIRSQDLRMVGETGMWDSGEALLIQKIRQGRRLDNPLNIYMNHQVVRIRPSSRRPTVIEAIDLITGRSVEFKAKNVVLAAGTLGTPAIALRSGLSEAAGIGVTDHPILYSRFAMPRAAPLHNLAERAKIVTQDRDASPDRHNWNLLTEMNTGQHESVYSHTNGLAPKTRAPRNREMVSELVFILHSPLNRNNRVSLDPATGWTRIDIAPVEVPKEKFAEMQAVADQIIKKLRGTPLTEDGRLLTAPMGCVAHEVGSMSDAVDDDGRVHGYDNIYVSDLSAFNFAPAANPTLTLVAMSLRLAEHLRVKLGKY